MQTSGDNKKNRMLESNIINATKAGKNKNIIAMDNSFLQFGPRIAQSIRDLSAQIYR